jgi:hypothetical protein
MKDTDMKTKAAGYIGLGIFILAIVSVALRRVIGFIDPLIFFVSFGIFYYAIVQKRNMSRNDWTIFLVLVAILAGSFILIFL